MLIIEGYVGMPSNVCQLPLILKKEFSVNNWVVLDMSNFMVLVCHKFREHFMAPFAIIDYIGNITYQID